MGWVFFVALIIMLVMWNPTNNGLVGFFADVFRVLSILTLVVFIIIIGFYAILAGA